MHHLKAILLLVLPVAACGGGGEPPFGPFSGPPPGPPPVVAQLRVGFGGIVDTIDIAAIERLPLRAAELVAPDGSAIPAGSITVDPTPRVATGQWAQSNRWQDAVTGNSALGVLTSQNPQAGAALQSQQQLLATVSAADIPLPDPVAYRRDWQQYRIRLTFGTPPADIETRELPAPAPLPPAR
jgi:hypothetical protein